MILPLYSVLVRLCPILGSPVQKIHGGPAVTPAEDYKDDEEHLTYKERRLVMQQKLPCTLTKEHRENMADWVTQIIISWDTRSSKASFHKPRGAQEYMIGQDEELTVYVCVYGVCQQLETWVMGVHVFRVPKTGAGESPSITVCLLVKPELDKPKKLFLNKIQQDYSNDQEI
ncbi:hypothetical protein HGM15179_015999 [Zosterops borbonicus]|uniref:Uncharacterized protein n=1 Tax=Zosterops borbonicus TaxID=364589 RepID=A0A8K1G3N3_9PASS|nr:hypothetical protein HGM15179_015999 [Zosterops borbonicus]